MLTDLKTALRPAVVLTLLFAALLGLIYPAVVARVGQALFPHQANGSLIRENGRVIGSELIGQRFESAGYFHGRPSAAGSEGYDATASAGSNLGPTSRALVERVKGDLAALQPSPASPAVPPDMVTASASGLDPHISPESALFQVPRIAKARGMAVEELRARVREHTEGRMLGFLGEPRINVLALNRDLDRKAARP
jgi:K+-transporting ATPase ATPase C chain